MAQLGDKQYTYNYYGVPDAQNRFWYKSGDTEPFAACVYPTVYGVPGFYGSFQTDGIYYMGDNPSPHNGQPLDTSIALWHIPRYASFACNCVFNIEQSNTITAHFTTNTEYDNVPLAMLATDIGSASYGGFGADFVGRYAYDVSYQCNGGFSRPIYDIAYNKFCYYAKLTYLNTSTGTRSTIALGSLANVIGNNENIDVCCIRCDLYYGMTPRTTNAGDYIPAQGAHETHLGVPTIDTLSNRPIPESETYLRSKIKDGHSEWRDDAVYSPWYLRYANLLYSTDTGANFSYQNDIGFDRQLSKNTIINGARTIDTGHNITAQLYRCNTDVKTFDDVVYKWDVAIYDDTNRVYLDNGFDITSYPNSATFRFYTKLVIVDKKGNSYGKAVELAVKHELAYIGFYFADTAALATNTELGTAATGVYLPLFSGGVTTGEYVTGDDIPLQPHATAGSIADPTFNYDPDETPGGEDTGDFRTRINSGAISAGTIYYAVSDTEFKDLVRYLNTTYNPDEADLAADFKGVNPFDYITSVKYYPFPLPYAVAQQINVGPLATGVTGYIMPYTYGNEAYSYFDFGQYTFTPRYKNFLDYSATQIQLFLPWCGVVNLDPTIWIAPPGYNPITLKIRYSFDYVTGSVTAFIFRDNGQGEFLIDTADGSAGVDVPLSLFATGSYQQQIAQAQIAYKQAATSRFATWAGVVGGLLGAGVSAAFGNPLGVVGGIGAAGGGLLKLKQAELQTDAVSYTLDHTQPQLGSVSAASPFNAAVMDQRPFILITRPRMQSTLPNTWETTYAHTVGYACTVPASLSDPRVRGFTVIQSPRLEGIKKSIGSATYTPTEQELSLIRQHMAAGIIL